MVDNKPPASYHPVTKQQHSAAIYNKRNFVGHLRSKQRLMQHRFSLSKQSNQIPQQPSPVKSIQADLTQRENKEVKDETACDEEEHHEQEQSNHILINAAKTSRVQPPSDFRMPLSSSDNTDPMPNTKSSLNTNSKRKINLHEL